MSVYHDSAFIHPFVSHFHPVPHPQEAGWSRLSFCNRFPDLPPSCLPPHFMYCTHACIRTSSYAYIYWTTTIVRIRHGRRSCVLSELPASQPTSPCLQQVACLPDIPASDISTPLQQATCSSFAVPSEEGLPCRILCPHSISFLTGSDNRLFSAHARREKVKAPNIVPLRTNFIL
ncbi:hypothetical protein F4814DRAFT_406513 [Daldinia grandis]|nr:hypothetical protein F4814DRAFT_406513 [Daldinia grandis]